LDNYGGPQQSQGERTHRQSLIPAREQANRHASPRQKRLQQRANISKLRKLKELHKQTTQVGKQGKEWSEHPGESTAPVINLALTEDLGIESSRAKRAAPKHKKKHIDRSPRRLLSPIHSLSLKLSKNKVNADDVVRDPSKRNVERELWNMEQAYRVFHVGGGGDRVQ